MYHLVLPHEELLLLSTVQYSLSWESLTLRAKRVTHTQIAYNMNLQLGQRTDVAGPGVPVVLSAAMLRFSLACPVCFTCYALVESQPPLLGATRASTRSHAPPTVAQTYTDQHLTTSARLIRPPEFLSGHRAVPREPLTQNMPA